MEVDVIDSGAGIREEDLNRLFQKFSKLELTEKANVDGIGLGLSICKKIAENSGGAIHVSSDGLNKGATFSFTMKMQ